MSTTRINCQFTQCDYVAEHPSEAVAIAMLTSHNNVHQQGTAQNPTKQRVPKIDRPELKQDVNDEEWQSFEAEWRRFKRCTAMSPDEVADQLFQCCESSLSKLLLKESPTIIEAGEQALMAAMKRMAVLHVATSVRRTNLLSKTQDHGQTFREFFANVRAAAATCAYNVQCTHACCATKAPVDYTSMVVKDILIAGIEDSEIRKDVLCISDIDSKTDKDIVKFVEEKEIARNALQSSTSTAALSSYKKSQKAADTNADNSTKKKLSMRGKCDTCGTDMSLYKQYKSGKLNGPFKTCISCYKKKRQEQNHTESSEASSILSFIGSIESFEEPVEPAVSEPVLAIASGEPACAAPSEEINKTSDILLEEVTISISSRAHDKFRQRMDIPTGSINEHINCSEVRDCYMGSDILGKLHCPRSALVKNKVARYINGKKEIGKAILQMEREGLRISQVVHVVESTTGLHLNARAITDLGLKSPLVPGNEVVHSSSELCAAGSHVILDHHIFTPAGWAKVSKLNHPKLRVRITTNKNDYDRMGFAYPTIAPKHIEVIADSGAQSCLWSKEEFLASGFSKRDLLPVRHTMKAANLAPIKIVGAIFLRLSGTSADGEEFEAAVMVYISPDARSFFLSKDAMIQLGIIAPSFPQIGSAAMPLKASVNSSELDQPRTRQYEETSMDADCGCPRRCLPPGKPKRLPFECSPENSGKMKKWLLDRYASSTFNQCPHQLLPSMDGPPVAFHVAKDAKPVQLTTPAPVPLHWQEKVKQDLDRDVNLGVLERVPYGEPTEWCFRMVIGRKHDGGPRRTVDLSPLNKFCKRETHPSKSPFHLARSVPQGSYKTVTDAWNGYHSCQIREQDRHLTTFSTPWGLFRYRRAPQGFLSSGDGYNRRFDAILAHFTQLVRCVDDSLLYDENLEEHWWRVIEFLEVAGKGGVVLNSNKFQFAQETVDFAGFRIAEDVVEPLPKYLDAIREYPTPTNIHDIRSWFGLVDQVSHYAQLRNMMEPFRKFLSPKVKFEWDDELETLFKSSKELIVDAIREGVKIFDPTRRTALMPDWSKTGIGFWLLQKYCHCKNTSPGCCQDGWRIVLAGSRFLSSAERNYAPVEGEALGVAWALEQTRFFTMGCSDLLVVVDHKPLVKLLGDRRLDEIVNPRLFRIKQRTLMWQFQIEYQPGTKNHVADAVSRRPNKFAEMASIDMRGEGDSMEELLIAGVGSDLDKFFAITWELVLAESQKDPGICALARQVAAGFPLEKGDMPPEIAEFWDFRHSLNVTDGVVLYNDRIVVPSSLRQRVLENLHSAHQGVTSMTSRAVSTVFWPGITANIENARSSCRTCHKNAPSQQKLPPVEPKIPKVPFEMICSDYFKLGGSCYLVIVDRLSGWSEVIQVKAGGSMSGAKGLCQALRQVFATFGVPEEISSDGGPEFTARESKDFYRRWGIRHRLSSAYFPQSNGRAKLAVKSTKRLLEDNVGPNGELNTDKVLCALLQQRNTPDRDCLLSPADILFGRQLRDGLPQLDKSKMIHKNPQLHEQWHQGWAAKESAIRSRLVRSCERLEANSRELEPLREGDSVFVQNQDPGTSRSKKWDRQGIIVATGDNDQYLVRIAGSGRLTLRNRRFLRRFQERSQSTNHKAVQPMSRFNDEPVDQHNPTSPFPNPSPPDDIPASDMNAGGSPMCIPSETDDDGKYCYTILIII